MQLCQHCVINIFMNKTTKPAAAQSDSLMEDLEFLSKLIVGIGEVAEITGIPQRQLRYWEQKGIIRTIQESGTSTRRFSYFEIKKILLIKDLLEEGYTLEAASKKLQHRLERLNAAFRKLKK